MEPAGAQPPRPRRAAPCTLVVFGATGDMTKRLLLPSLYHLAIDGLLAEEFAIVGVSRAPWSDDQFREHIRGSLAKFAGAALKPKIVDWLLQRATYVPGDFDDTATFDRLRGALDKATRTTGGNRLFYLATPPAVFAEVAEHLGRAGLAREENGLWSRLIVEKPFGNDLASACELNRRILAVFSEKQVFRIDHFLGKETVQNILALRFANGMFESLWNRDRIDHVQITVAETVALEGRGKFYDATGALRDMVPNHLFQLLSLIAMEPPSCFAADAVRGEKTKVLQAVHRYSAAEALKNSVRGQYAGGTVNGQTVLPYRKEPDVAPDSNTETYVALRLTVDNWRWSGVPFYLRTGKALAARRTEIAIKFKEAPFTMFRDTPVEKLAQNFIVIRIAPDEGIAIWFNAKVPGPQLRLDGVRMDFKYKDYFAVEPSSGYETLIYDCMNGDQTLFQHAEDVEAAWGAVQPLLDGWREARANDLDLYPAGSEGPAAADNLLARDHRSWRPIAPKNQ